MIIGKKTKICMSTAAAAAIMLTASCSGGGTSLADNAVLSQESSQVTENAPTAAKTVELSTFLKLYTTVRNALGSKVVFAILLVLIILVGIYILVFVSRMKEAKKRSEAKRRRREQFDEQMNINSRNSNRGRRNDDLPPPRR